MNSCPPPSFHSVIHLIALGVGVGQVPFLDEGHFVFDFIEQGAGLGGGADDLGTEEDEEFGAFAGFVAFAEDVFQDGDAAQNGGFVAGIGGLLLDLGGVGGGGFGADS